MWVGANECEQSDVRYIKGAHFYQYAVCVSAT